jgi:hypothetical protein
MDGSATNGMRSRSPALSDCSKPKVGATAEELVVTLAAGTEFFSLLERDGRRGTAATPHGHSWDAQAILTC